MPLTISALPIKTLQITEITRGNHGIYVAYTVNGFAEARLFGSNDGIDEFVNQILGSNDALLAMLLAHYLAGDGVPDRTPLVERTVNQNFGLLSCAVVS